MKNFKFIYSYDINDLINSECQDRPNIKEEIPSEDIFLYTKKRYNFLNGTCSVFQLGLLQNILLILYKILKCLFNIYLD